MYGNLLIVLRTTGPKTEEEAVVRGPGPDLGDAAALDRDRIARNTPLQSTISLPDASEYKEFQYYLQLSVLFSWAELKDYMRKAGEVTYVDAHNRMGRGDYLTTAL